MENAVVLREWFERVDSNRSGNITALQLQGALSVGNLDFSLSIVQQMIRMYDFDGNGTMNFEEFLALNKFLLKVQNLFTVLERYCTYPSTCCSFFITVVGRALNWPCCKFFSHIVIILQADLILLDLLLGPLICCKILAFFRRKVYSFFSCTCQVLYSAVNK
ncbi:hypothetical protein BHE74_00059604 [Ensete ventricosum]|nr:hypothetical protein BHE74_00059604 [Ensete ventricosum]